MSCIPRLLLPWWRPRDQATRPSSASAPPLDTFSLRFAIIVETVKTETSNYLILTRVGRLARRTRSWQQARLFFFICTAWVTIL